MSDKANSTDDNDNNVRDQATDADRKRRSKLEELLRRRAEHAPQQLETPSAPAPGPTAGQGDRRAKLRELLDRDRESGTGDRGGLRGELLKRALQNRRDGGRGDGAKNGNGGLLRLLKERANNEERRGGAGVGDGRLLRQRGERAGVEGRGGGSDREAELEERVRRLEAELKSLRGEIPEPGEASSSDRPADDRPRRLRTAVRKDE
jgi:hypothetical protein